MAGEGSKCPVPHDKPHPLVPTVGKDDSKPASGGCPVAHGSGSADPDQSKPLPTDRKSSTIPTAHGKEGDTWTYPSPQMFYNAIKKKGWGNVQEDAIHNAVNEHCWQKVMEWEDKYKDKCAAPKLKKFQGKAAEFSPKAKFNNMLGYKMPFDRHDWIVDRCGEQVRYIIDFYEGKQPHPGAPPALYVDVRPALDSFQAVVDRTSRYFKSSE